MAAVSQLQRIILTPLCHLMIRLSEVCASRSRSLLPLHFSLMFTLIGRSFSVPWSPFHSTWMCFYLVLRHATLHQTVKRILGDVILFSSFGKSVVTLVTAYREDGSRLKLHSNTTYRSLSSRYIHLRSQLSLISHIINPIFQFHPLVPLCYHSIVFILPVYFLAWLGVSWHFVPLPHQFTDPSCVPPDLAPLPLEQLPSPLPCYLQFL